LVRRAATWARSAIFGRCRCHSLQNFDVASRIPDRLRIDSARLVATISLCSVEVNGKIHGSLLLQKTDDHWDDSGEANTAATRQLVATRSKYAETHHLAPTAFHSVSIPALNAYFVAVNAGAETILIPVQTDPSLGLVAGEAQPAQKLMPRLAVAATALGTQSPGVR
jgi:hypothetical protein